MKETASKIQCINRFPMIIKINGDYFLNSINSLLRRRSVIYF
jgi:hypothetical protein